MPTSPADRFGPADPETILRQGNRARALYEAQRQPGDPDFLDLPLRDASVWMRQVLREEETTIQAQQTARPTSTPRPPSRITLLLAERAKVLGNEHIAWLNAGRGPGVNERPLETWSDEQALRAVRRARGSGNTTTHPLDIGAVYALMDYHNFKYHHPDGSRWTW